MCSNLKTEDLKNINFLRKTRVKKPILSVSEYKVPIEWAFNMERSGKLVSINRKFQLIRSQDIKKSILMQVNFVFILEEIFKLNFVKKNYHYIGYKLPAKKSIDIDDIEDWKLAEKLF